MKYFFAILLLLLPCRGSYAQIIVPIAGSGGTVDADGPATAVALDNPMRIAFDDTGSLYICDWYHHKLRKVKPSFQGYMTTIAGTGVSGDWGDGGPASSAGLGAILDVAIDKRGNIYLADAFYNKIRKIDKDGIITTIAGTGIAGYNGDGIAATSAKLNSPLAVKVDDTGNVYIGDRSNYRLRKVDTFGIIKTIAGTGVAGFSGDGGPAIAAKTNGLMAIALDTAGNIYFSDTVRIRKIAVDGTINTVAGNGILAFAGDGGPATTASIRPAGIFVDKTGALYIADDINHRIRKVGVDGIISTIAGTGMAGISGDWGPPLLATICAPNGVAVNTDGDIYFSNQCGASVKMITNRDLRVPHSLVSTAAVELFPNPARHTVSISVRSEAEEASVTIAAITGAVVARKTVTCNVTHTIATPWPKGIYMVCVVVGGATITKQVYVD